MDIVELTHLVDRYGKPVFGFCYKLAGNRADADDLYQDTFLKAAELCEKIDADGNIKAYLMGIAARLWRNSRRKLGRRNRIAPLTDITDAEDYYLREEESLEDIVIANETMDALRRSADALGDRLRIPLYMHYTAGMSIEEIAGALKLPPGTVKSRLFKARSLLKQELEVHHAYGWI